MDTLRGSTTVPGGALKSSTPTCVRNPRLVSSKNIAPFLGAFCCMRRAPAPAGSDTCNAWTTWIQVLGLLAEIVTLCGTL